jgi:hypothetical protein
MISHIIYADTQVRGEATKTSRRECLPLQQAASGNYQVIDSNNDTDTEMNEDAKRMQEKGCSC